MSAPSNLLRLCAVTSALTLTGVGVAFAAATSPTPTSTDGATDSAVVASHANHKHGGQAGHLPGSSAGLSLVGQMRINQDTEGRVADVAVHEGHAYVAAFNDGDCQKGGVYVFDIRDVRAPKQINFIRTANNSYVGEGAQTLSISTPAFTGDLLVHNNETCTGGGNAGGTDQSVGGIGLIDVSNPKTHTVLAQGFGDVSGTSTKAHTVHSAFAWQPNAQKAYAVLVDNEESADIDIADITDPRKPKIIAEYDLDAEYGVSQPELGDGSSFLHDMVVTKINGRQTMIASYWDGGYVQLDVTDPTNATLINETDFAAKDPERAKRGENVLPEGNAHQAEFTANRSAFVATDEDFSPYKLESKMADGTAFRAQAGAGYKQIQPGETVSGPTVHVGLGCTTSPPAPAEPGAIALVERGGCPFQEKADNVAAAGYQTGVVFNNQANGDAIVNMAGTNPKVRFSFVSRSDGLRILRSFDSTKPSTQQASPAVGTVGQDVTFRSFFDGWGYVHLYDRATAKELGTYAIPESQDAKFAQGFGDLSVHEVATDPKSSLAYLSYYSGGFRVVDTAGGKLKEVGAFIDEGGNNFWGVEVTRVPQYGQVVLASDRDFGLYVLQYAPGSN